jgi:hypothetical protein
MGFNSAFEGLIERQVNFFVIIYYIFNVTIFFTGIFINSNGKNKKVLKNIVSGLEGKK